MGYYNKMIGDALSLARKTSGVSIKYNSGDTYVRLNAQIGKTDFGSADVKAVNINERSRDYLVSVCDLAKYGIDEPQVGDTITETIGNKVYTYTVSNPTGGSEQPWRFSDTGQTQFRIHTKIRSVGNV